MGEDKMNIWFMRDNHTFIEFPTDATKVIDFLEALNIQKPNFYHYGYLNWKDDENEEATGPDAVHIEKPTFSEFVVEVLTFYGKLPKELTKEEQVLRAVDRFKEELVGIFKRRRLLDRHEVEKA
jgi:hypothetical protein